MSRLQSRCVACCAGLLVLAGSATATAADDDPESALQSDSEPAASEPVAGSGSVNVDEDQTPTLQLAVGIRGGVSGVAGFGFEDNESIEDNQGNTLPPPTDSTWFQPEYYPHGGAGGGGGASLELRYDGFLGLETGFSYSADNAAGYVDKRVNGQDVARIHSQQTTRSFRIPALLKVNIPSDSVRPFIGAGVQYVGQMSSELEYTQEPYGNRRYGSEDDMDRLNERNQIEPSSYWQALGTAGVEVSAGPVRIPVELRVGYTLGYDQEMEERSRGEDGQIIYDGVYLGHFGVFAGVLYEFDLGL